MNQIIQGFINLAMKELRSENHSVEVKARERLTICGDCKHRAGMICSKCGCYLPSKVRSTKVCKYW